MHSRDALLAIARYARGQWGMVTSAQATAVGVNYSLAGYEITWADGLPVTTATRTLTDLLADGIPASAAGTFLAEALDRRMLNVSSVIEQVAPFAARYGCRPADGQQLVELLLDQAPVASGRWDREQTVADLARELLRLPDDQLRSLRSLASAAREPAVAALLSRVENQRKL